MGGLSIVTNKTPRETRALRNSYLLSSVSFLPAFSSGVTRTYPFLAALPQDMPGVQSNLVPLISIDRCHCQELSDELIHVAHFGLGRSPDPRDISGGSAVPY
jgi:hypothetical protein